MPWLASFVRRILPLLLLANPAFADGPPPLIAVLSGDWDADGTLDAVVLVPGIDGDADLILYEGGGSTGLTPVLTLPGVVFAGTLAGQAPSLTAINASSFVLSSEQSAVGRTPWARHITIAWQDGGFVVAGFDYSFYDRLDLTHDGDCSVDLMIRQFTLSYGPGDGAPDVNLAGPTEAAAFPLAELRAGYMAAPCGRLFD